MRSKLMEDILNKMVKENVFPGANYVVIKDGVHYYGSVGNKSLVPKIEENSLDNIYDIASITKVLVTTTIITKLLSKNIISLDDYVQKYLKDFKHKDIKLINLLTHTSGLSKRLDYKGVTEKEELLKRLYDIPLENEIGKIVVYSDINFILLGIIIEKIYDKPLDQIAQEEVFVPLDMKETMYNPKKISRCVPTEITEDRGLIVGEVHDTKAHILNNVAGHAGVFSTVKDMSKFCEMILNNGIIKGKEFLKKEYLDLWFKPFIEMEGKQYRSIGWLIGHSDNITGEEGDINTIYHTGYTGTHIIINKEKNFAGVLLTNRVHPTRENTLLQPRRKEFYITGLKIKPDIQIID